MTGRGRPLRFLALIAIGWVGGRLLLAWPRIDSLPDAVKAVVPRLPVASAGDAPAMAVRAMPAARAGSPPRFTLSPARWGKPDGPPAPIWPRPDPVSIQLALLGLMDYGEGQPYGDTPAIGDGSAALRSALAIGLQQRLPRSPSPWSASAWLVARSGPRLAAAPGGGQLGGSQAGVRIAYMLAPRARLAAFARASAPLQGKGSEAALGLEWQPGKAPVRLVAEHRFGLDGIEGGPGIALIGGLDQTLGRAMRVEAYGQAGAIHRARLEPYADGAVRVTREVAEVGGVRLSLGAGAWGGVQRGASRLDVGPSVALALPVAGQNLRLAVDWRQRVAGGARPGSGPALTLGMDF